MEKRYLASRTALVLATIALPLAAQDAGVGSNRPKGRVHPASGTVVVISDPLHVPSSLSELVSRSQIIVEASVAGEPQTWRRNQDDAASIETMVVTSVSRVLKGSGGLRRLVISRRGGTLAGLTVTPAQDTAMNAGERYVLFLVDDPRPNPLDKELPRAVVVGIWSGKFLVRDNVVHASQEASPGLRASHGEPIGRFLDRIVAEVSAQRQVEGGGPR